MCLFVKKSYVQVLCNKCPKGVSYISVCNSHKKPLEGYKIRASCCSRPVSNLATTFKVITRIKFALLLHVPDYFCTKLARDTVNHSDFGKSSAPIMPIHGQVQVLYRR